MKRIALGLVALSLVAAALVTGCVTNVGTSSPTPSPTPGTQDYTTYFETRMTSYGTVVSPLMKVSDNVYTGSYRSFPKNNSSFTTAWKIEILNSEAAAKAQYGQLIIQKQDDGFTVQQSNELVGPTIFGDVSASWYGYKLNGLVSASVFEAMYGHNSEINEWFVVTMNGDTVSSSMS